MEGPQDGRAGPVVGIWMDRVWPLLAGTLVGTGLLAVIGSYGVAGTTVMVLGLTTFLTVMAYGVLSESSGAISNAWRLGLAASVGVVAVVGLVDLAPQVAWHVIIACAATSPPALVRTTQLRRIVSRRLAERRGRRPAPTPLPRHPAQAAVDRAFDEIVRDLRDRGR
jgi:hypothetical protein